MKLEIRFMDHGKKKSVIKITIDGGFYIRVRILRKFGAVKKASSRCREAICHYVIRDERKSIMAEVVFIRNAVIH